MGSEMIELGRRAPMERLRASGITDQAELRIAFLDAMYGDDLPLERRAHPRRRGARQIALKAPRRAID